MPTDVQLMHSVHLSMTLFSLSEEKSSASTEKHVFFVISAASPATLPRSLPTSVSRAGIFCDASANAKVRAVPPLPRITMLPFFASKPAFFTALVKPSQSVVVPWSTLSLK